MTPRTVCWFSCGAASAVMCRIVRAENPQAVIARCIVANEHSDNDRFAADVARWLNVEVMNLRSEKYADCWDVWEKRRFLNSPGGALCTVELKKKVRQAFERIDDVQCFGYTIEEQDRADRFRQNNPEINARFPLIENGVRKADCYDLIRRAGLELPAMYRLGYHNANCIGCVKGGAGYWNKIRRDFPIVFARMATLEETIGATVLRQKIGNRSVPRPLRTLPLDAGRHEDLDLPDCGLFCGENEGLPPPLADATFLPPDGSVGCDESAPLASGSGHPTGEPLRVRIPIACPVAAAGPQGESLFHAESVPTQPEEVNAMDIFIPPVDLTKTKIPGPRAGRAVRREGDTYDTPAPLALAICQRLMAMGLSPARVLEPSAGHGAFVAAVRSVWPGVEQIAAVEPRAECAAGLAAAGAIPWTGRLEDYARGTISDADLIVGNPPYNEAAAHCRLLLDAMKPGAVLAFLLRINFLGISQESTEGTKARAALFEAYPISALWPVWPRPSFTPDGKTDPTEYGVIIWQKGSSKARFAPVRW